MSFASNEALAWVRANGYDSSTAEGVRFWNHMRTLAADGETAALKWLEQAKGEAGHQVLLRASNADRVGVPTPVGERSTSIRGSVQTRTEDGIDRQRELFVMLSVEQYMAWYRQQGRKHLRDAGYLAAHGRVIDVLKDKPGDLVVGDVLEAAGKTWEGLMSGTG